MGKKAYKYKYTQAKKLNMFSILLVVVAVVSVYLSTKTTKKWKTYAEDLVESQNIMVWEMDESCFKQIQNSSDGVIRLQIK